MTEIGLLLVLVVVLAAARVGMTAGMLAAAFAVIVLLAAHALVTPEGVTAANSIAFTLCFVASAFIVGRQRDRLNQVRGVHRLVHAEAIDVDERLSNVLERVTDGFVTIDEGWRLTYVNQRAERIFGRARGHLIGRSALEMFPEGIGSRIHQELDRARSEHQPIEFEAWYHPAQRWFEIRAYPVEEGGLTVYFRDVTRRKEAQGSLAVQARLLDAVGQAVVAAGNDGRIFYCNHAAEELFGWPARDMVHNVEITALEPSSDMAADRLLQRARTTRGWSGEVTLRRRDGSAFPAHVSDSPIVDHDGSFIGMVRVAQDASARLAEQHSQRLLADAGSALAATLNYEHTLATVVEFVVPELADCCIVDVTEPDSNERRIETAWSSALGHAGATRSTRRTAAAEPSGAQLVVGEDAVLITSVSDNVLRQLTTNATELNRLRTAEVRAVIIAPLNVGGRKLGTLSAVAITRVFGESDVELINELARRAAFAIDNAVLYETASMANQSKSDFLAVMSHELRTPLTTVMGYTDLLLAGVTTQLTQQSQTYVERIRTAAWHLLGLIEQILIYARLEVGREQVHVEKVQAVRVLRDAAELIEPVASEKGLRFTLIEPPQDVIVETDTTKLRQILLNMLSNAVKFTEKGSVELEGRTTGAYVQFLVHDTGVGIAPEHQKRVFDSFWQVDQSATRKEGGTGIGLSVSRKLARLLGGDITVRSTPEQGTTFTLSLPLSGLTKTTVRT